jgi:hypothetical protein
VTKPSGALRAKAGRGRKRSIIGRSGGSGNGFDE